MNIPNSDIKRALNLVRGESRLGLFFQNSGTTICAYGRDHEDNQVVLYQLRDDLSYEDLKEMVVALLSRDLSMTQETFDELGLGRFFAALSTPD